MGEYLVEGIFLAFALEGGLGGEEDVEDDSAAPEVAAVGEVALDDLRGHVAHGPHQLAALHLWTHQLAGSAEVQELDFYLIVRRVVLNLLDEHHVF